MTTDKAMAKPVWRRIGTYFLGAVAAVVGWAAILAVVTLLQQPGGRVAVISPSGTGAALAAVVEAGGAIVEIRRWAVIAASDEPGFVARLYRRGPVLVVGARKGGCGFGAVVGISPDSLT